MVLYSLSILSFCCFSSLKSFVIFSILSSALSEPAEFVPDPDGIKFRMQFKNQRLPVNRPKGSASLTARFRRKAAEPQL
jgi:hypothetical protein